LPDPVPVCHKHQPFDEGRIFGVFAANLWQGESGVEELASLRQLFLAQAASQPCVLRDPPGYTTIGSGCGKACKT
jgi:hypothetical protein